MSPNPFSVRYLRPEVELMYVLRIVTKVADNGVARPKRPHLYRKTDALNSNKTSDFKPEVVIWSKLRMRSEESPK